MHSALQDVRSAPIDVTTLNLDVFDDEDLAEDVGQDVLRLFEQTDEAFESIRNQKWYKRLWVTLTGGNTRTLAQGCQSLGEAQHLLMRVLEVGQAYTRRSNELMVYVTRGLRHMESQQNEVVRHLLHVDERVGLVEEELDVFRAHVSLDPSDVTSWSPGDRTLLFSVMVAASMSDGEIQEEERALLLHTLRDLGLEGAYHEEAMRILDTTSPLEDCGEHLDSYRMRLVVYRHAVGVSFAHGRLDAKERSFLRWLSERLHLRPDDAKRITNGFERLQHVPDAANLRRMLSPAAGGDGAPHRAALADVTKRRHELKVQERELEAARSRSEEELSAIAKTWAATLSEAMSYWMLSPLYERAEAYGTSEPSDVEELVRWWDPSVVLEEVNPQLSEVGTLLTDVVADIDEALRLPADVHHRLGAAWGRVVKDDAGWERALTRVQRAGARMQEASPSGIFSFARGGAIGGLAGFFLGPVGIAGALAATYFLDSSDEEEFGRAAQEWDEAVSAFLDATEAWRSKAEDNLSKYLLYVVDETRTGLKRLSDPDEMGGPAAMMREHINAVNQQLS